MEDLEAVPEVVPDRDAEKNDGLLMPTHTDNTYEHSVDQELCADDSQATEAEEMNGNTQQEETEFADCEQTSQKDGNSVDGETAMSLLSQDDGNELDNQEGNLNESWLGEENNEPDMSKSYSVRSVQDLVSEIETKLEKEDNDAWTRHETEEGDEYWYNSETCVSQWTNPSMVVDSVVPPEAPESEIQSSSPFQEAISIINKLHEAVQLGNVKDVEMLVVAGIDVNAVDRNGMTPLFHAVSAEMVDLLASLGANIEARFRGDSVCHHYARVGTCDALQQILRMYEADPEQSTLHETFPLFNDNGETPLHLAASHDQLACVVLLTRYNKFDQAAMRAMCLSEYQDLGGRRPVDLAPANSQTLSTIRDSMVHAELLQCKSRMEQLEHQTKELHHWKERARHAEASCNDLSEQVTQLEEVIRTLQQEVEQNHIYANSENVWEQHFTEDGKSYFYNPATNISHWTVHEEPQAWLGATQQQSSAKPAADDKVMKVWEKFFERAAKASLNRIEQPNNSTPQQQPNELLATGIDLIDPETVHNALLAGASATDDLSDNSEVETMMHRCCALHWDGDKHRQRRILKVASLLVDYGSEIDAIDDRGVSPLHIACSVGNDMLTEFLLQTAAKVHVVDANGDTPLHVAAIGGTKGHLKCVQLLTRYGANLTWANVQGNTPVDCARIQMVISENPPKALCQVVSLLQQLLQVAGDDPNPFAAGSYDDNDERQRREDNKNPYRKTSSTRNFIPIPPALPPPDERNIPEDDVDEQKDSSAGWLSSLFNKVLDSTSPRNQERKNTSTQPENSTGVERPPSDQELQELRDGVLVPPPDVQKALEKAGVTDEP
mmetsp:Transcript_17826/g.30407  ORF Transcript_17826/g.30407 Transcript_17826/m.30407 type:complete len:836 (-) Transcript_17826:4776-7283(-)